MPIFLAPSRQYVLTRNTPSILSTVMLKSASWPSDFALFYLFFFGIGVSGGFDVSDVELSD